MKTLLIRNQRRGMIWQVYHVRNHAEALMLEQTARANGFQAFDLRNYDDSHDESCPGWRDTEVWKERWAKESTLYSAMELKEFKTSGEIQ